jgi:hypothetical protein
MPRWSTIASPTSPARRRPRCAGPRRAGGHPDAPGGRALADLAASYMVAGFVHGVLNTDNMNVTGESFDYGPWRWLPQWDPGFTAAYFDHAGLYAFGRQPEAIHWNCGQLAVALRRTAGLRACHRRRTVARRAWRRGRHRRPCAPRLATVGRKAACHPHRTDAPLRQRSAQGPGSFRRTDRTRDGQALVGSPHRSRSGDQQGRNLDPRLCRTHRQKKLDSGLQGTAACATSRTG